MGNGLSSLSWAFGYFADNGLAKEMARRSRQTGNPVSIRPNPEKSPAIVRFIQHLVREMVKTRNFSISLIKTGRNRENQNFSPN